MEGKEDEYFMNRLYNRCDDGHKRNNGGPTSQISPSSCGHDRSNRDRETYCWDQDRFSIAMDVVERVPKLQCRGGKF